MKKSVRFFLCVVDRLLFCYLVVVDIYYIARNSILALQTIASFRNGGKKVICSLISHLRNLRLRHVRFYNVKDRQRPLVLCGRPELHFKLARVSLNSDKAAGFWSFMKTAPRANSARRRSSECILFD